MQLKYLLSFAIVLAVISTMSQSVEARRFKLRPLSAREVYRILKEAGREDAIPEGRIVTQGIAAMTGFTLGLTKGIGGSLLFDLATSNATSEFINNFNMTALTEMFSGSSSTNTSSSGTTYQTQEICFSSRSMEPGLQSRNAKYNENDENGRIATFIGTTTATTSPTQSDTTSGSGGGTTAGTATATATGTATGTNTGQGTGTSVDTGTVTNSATNTETDTGTGASQTCIVIQKPKSRKRRSSHRRKRH